MLWDAGTGLDRNPNFEPARSGTEIECVAETFETRRVGDLIPRGRQPPGPDRALGAADRRNVPAMFEHGIAPRADPQPAERRRQIGEVAHLRAGDVIEIADVIAVVGHAESGATELAGNISKMRHEALPLRRNRLAGLPAAT